MPDSAYSSSQLNYNRLTTAEKCYPIILPLMEFVKYLNHYKEIWAGAGLTI
jgi:hypothetical protein